MKHFVPELALIAGMILGSLALVWFASSGCGYGGKVCSAIDLAHQACEKLPIRYMTPDGREVTVMVPRDELLGVARRHAP